METPSYPLYPVREVWMGSGEAFDEVSEWNTYNLPTSTNLNVCLNP